MAKRQVHKGSSSNPRVEATHHARATNSNKPTDEHQETSWNDQFLTNLKDLNLGSNEFRYIFSQISRYVLAGYNMLIGNFLALATVFAIVFMIILISDISQKVHATNELKSMKTVLNLVTKEVDRAEVACLTAADEICHLQRTMQANVADAEIVIMSHLYTD